jgi:hypothetical protein
VARGGVVASWSRRKVRSAWVQPAGGSQPHARRRSASWRLGGERSAWVARLGVGVGGLRARR